MILCTLVRQPSIVCGIERINVLECAANLVQYAPTEYLLAEDDTTILAETSATLLT